VTLPLPEPAAPDALPDNVRALRPRRRFREWPLTAVLLVMAAAAAVIASDHFRRGAVLFSAAVLLAFFLRLLLPERDSGMLAVRSKPLDLGVLAALGLAFSFLAFAVPAPS
jgi:hypothetical protein